MYDSTTTVAVGLDVHARSIRVAAVRADELLEERTLPYAEEQVERLLRRWPSVRCCYEAGPTGFGLQRHLVECGIDCQVVAPGLVPQRPGDRIKTDPRDARRLARLLAGGLLEAIHVPSRELEAARDLVRAREDARLDRMRARDRHADRARARHRDRRLRPLQERRAVHGVRRARPLGALLRRAAAPRLDHQGRQRARASAAGRVGLAREAAANRGLPARPAPA